MEKRRSPADPKRWGNPEQRGNSMCYPSSKKSIEVLKEKGLEGIEYKDFEPQFGPVAEATVQIGHMTKHRERSEPLDGFEQFDFDKKVDNQTLSTLHSIYTHLGNYDQADVLLAKKWDEERKDGREWTPLEVKKYRKKNKLTWHERWDQTTMDLVPTCVHDDFRHTGAVAYMKEIEKILSEWEDAEELAYHEERGACPLQLVLLVGMIFVFVSSFIICDVNGFLDFVLWSVATFAPYVALLAFCRKGNGLPKFLRGRFGGLLLLALFGLLSLMIPWIVEKLYMVYFLGCGYLLLKGLSVFAPDSTLTVELHHEDGTVTRETRAVYGDMDSAIRQAESEYGSQGYERMD